MLSFVKKYGALKFRIEMLFPRKMMWFAMTGNLGFFAAPDTFS